MKLKIRHLKVIIKKAKNIVRNKVQARKIIFIQVNYEDMMFMVNNFRYWSLQYKLNNNYLLNSCGLNFAVDDTYIVVRPENNADKVSGIIKLKRLFYE